jgi:hypothetical protein
MITTGCNVGNTDESTVFFCMLTDSTIDAKRLKSVLVKTTDNKKLRITVMLTVLAV